MPLKRLEDSPASSGSAVMNAFEAWQARSETDSDSMETYVTDGETRYMHREMQEQWEAWQAALAWRNEVSRAITAANLVYDDDAK